MSLARVINRMLRPIGLHVQSARSFEKAISFNDVWNREHGVNTADGHGDFDIGDSVVGYLRAYRHHPDVRRCVDLRANLIASVPLRLYRLGADGRSRKPVEDHRVLRLLEEVNPHDDTTRSGLWRRTEQSLCIYGDCFWWMNRANPPHGRPRGIYVMHSSQIEYDQVEFDPKHWIQAIPYKLAEGKLIRYNYGELVHFRYPDPNHAFKGVSPIASVRKDVEAGLYARAWNAQFFQNGARISVALLLPELLTDEERRKARDDFKRAFQGTDHAHEPIVLEGGAKIVDLQLRPKDADWLALCQRGRESIYDVYGVPIELSGGAVEDAAQVARHEATEFWTQTLIPEMAMLAETLRWRLLRMGYLDLDPRKHLFEFDVSDVPAVRRANMDRVEAFERAVGGPYLKRNEVRGLIGLPPLTPEDEEKMSIPYKYEMKYRGKGDEPEPEPVAKMLAERIRRRLGGNGQ